MALVWSVYDRVSDVLGSDVMAIALVVAVAVAFYFLMVQPGPRPAEPTVPTKAMGLLRRRIRLATLQLAKAGNDQIR